MARKPKKLNLSSKWMTKAFALDPLPGFDPKELIFAQQLQDIEKLYLDLDTIRTRINLKKLLTYPKLNSLENLFRLRNSLPSLNQKVLEINVENLMERIGAVSIEWKFALEVLVLTNILPIMKNSPFVLSGPNDFTSSYFYGPKKLPTLSFRFKFTPTELIKWVGENKAELKKLGDVLPNRPAGENDVNVMLIQRIIFTLKEYEGKI